jgi:hypothetical protein
MVDDSPGPGWEQGLDGNWRRVDAPTPPRTLHRQTPTTQPVIPPDTHGAGRECGAPVAAPPKVRSTKAGWIAGIAGIVVVGAVVGAVAASGGGSSLQRAAIRSGTTASSTTVPVRSLSANLLQASSIAFGSGWKGGNGFVTSNTASMSPCAKALWAVFDRANYPAYSDADDF